MDGDVGGDADGSEALVVVDRDGRRSLGNGSLAVDGKGAARTNVQTALLGVEGGDGEEGGEDEDAG